MIPNWSWNWESWQNSGLSEIWCCGQSAGKGRTFRRSWDLSTRGSAELFSTAKLHCGRSACVGKNSKADGPPGYRGQSATGQNGGVGQTWLIMGVPLTPPHQTAHLIQKLSLSLSSTWVRRQGQGFLAWFPDGPRTSPDSSQDCASCPLGIFDKSLTLVLGFLYWKELGLDAPICFWTMDSWKYLGDLVPSDEEML